MVTNVVSKFGIYLPKLIWFVRWMATEVIFKQ